MMASITLQFIGFAYVSLYEKETSKNLCYITCHLVHVQVDIAFVISQISGQLAPLM